MANKAAYRLTNPFAIGAMFSGQSALILSGFGDGDMFFDSVQTRALRKLRTYGGRGLPLQHSEVIHEFLRDAGQLRSHYRFFVGKYQHIAYQELNLMLRLEIQNEHFLHVDPENKERVRYFQSAEHRKEDRHTSTTLGRYLTTYYSDVYTPEVIRDIATHFTAGTKRMDFRILWNEGDIVDAYKSGPRSCMAYEESRYSTGGMHPVRVYGTPGDLALAVLRDGGKITARCIVWPGAKIHSRIYGDAIRMRKALRDNGFRYDRLDGARIRRIQLGNNQLLMPYIDNYNEDSDCDSGAGAMHVQIPNDQNAEYCILTGDSDDVLDEYTLRQAGETRGYVLDADIARCECCSLRGERSHMLPTFNGDVVCARCAAQNYWLIISEQPTRRTLYISQHQLEEQQNDVAYLTDTGQLIYDPNFSQRGQHPALDREYYLGHMRTLPPNINAYTRTSTPRTVNFAGRPMRLAARDTYAVSDRRLPNDDVLLAARYLPTRAVVVELVSSDGEEVVSVASADELPDLIARGATEVGLGFGRYQMPERSQDNAN